MSIANPAQIGSSHLRAACVLHRAEANGLEFRWNGKVQESTTTYILDWIEQRLRRLDSEALQKKRILRVAIEMLQNLHHHAKAPHDQIVFEVVTDRKSAWWIRSENPISKQQMEYLQSTLNELSSIHPNELRTMQRDKIAHQERSEHGGGGVGLNELIRKSLGQIYVEFINCNKNKNAYRVVFITKLEWK
tara:strand:- start:591 stop:1160 length:570 start_codon:yes stop_codon:yes gene_type:complete